MSFIIDTQESLQKQKKNQNELLQKPKMNQYQRYLSYNKATFFQKVHLSMKQIWDKFIFNQYKLQDGSSLNYQILYKNSKQPGLPYSFKTKWNYSFDKQQNFNLKIIFFEIKNHKNRLVQLSKHAKLLDKLQPIFLERVRSYRNSSIVKFYRQSNLIQLQCKNNLTNSDNINDKRIFRNVMEFIKLISKQVKYQIVQRLLADILYDKYLTKDQRIQLLAFRQIFDYQRITRSKRQCKKELTMVPFAANKINQIGLEIFHFKKQLIIYKSKVAEKYRQVSNSLSKYCTLNQQEKRNYPQHQSNEWFQKSLKDVKQYIKKVINSVRTIKMNPLENFIRDQICQGIKILGDVKQIKAIVDTKISKISKIECTYEYLFSVNQYEDYRRYLSNLSSNPSLDEQRNNQFRQSIIQTSIQTSEQQNQQIITKQRYLIKKDIKTKKRSDNLAFKNQREFIKWIRLEIWPYIAKYYLESNRQSNYDWEDQETQIQEDLSQEQERFYKIQRRRIMKSQIMPIYIQEYDTNLSNYLISKLETLNILKVNQLLIQIASTINFLFEKKVLHRDLKPDNIMIDKQQRVRFVDFGSSSNHYSQQNHSIGFKQENQPLRTTYQYSQYFIDIHCQTFAKQQFKDEIKFQKNKYYDVYSFGIILKKDIIPTLIKKGIAEDFWYKEQLEYVSNKCIEANPFDRLSPRQIMMYLMHLQKILQQKKKQLENKQGLDLNQAHKLIKNRQNKQIKQQNQS